MFNMQIYTNKTLRVFEDFKILPKEKLRKASYQDFFEKELQIYFQSKLAHCIFKDYDYSIFSYAKNAFNSEYELFLNCFPSTGYKIVHTLDEFPKKWQKRFFNSIEIANTCLLELMKQNNEMPRRIYSLQHIGLEELDNYDFSITYEQIHYHIFAITNKTLKSCVLKKNPFKTPNLCNTFYEPFLILYYDFMVQINPSLLIDYKTSSLIIQRGPFNLSIKEDTRELIIALLEYWKIKWREIALCLTNFKVGENQRHIPFSIDKRMKNIYRLFDKYPSLSITSKKLLLWLSKNIQEHKGFSNVNEKRYWRIINKNINGSIGITHDFDSHTTTVRFAPRTFILTERIGATDGFYWCIKDRNTSYSNKERSKIIKNQNRLIDLMKKYTNNNKRD